MSTTVHGRKRNLYWFQEGACHWCGTHMTTKRQNGGPLPANYATLDHLDDRLSGERGKHGGEYRVVLACSRCNNERAQAADRAIPIEERWRRSGRAPREQVS